jgi:hypothetical protein
VPRRHGETLKRLYNGNRKSNPQAMCLISWNEITEGTYIEPLRRYGDGYVKTHREAVTGYSAQRPQALQDLAAIGSVRTTRPPQTLQRVGIARTKAWMVRTEGSARPLELASELCGNLHALAPHLPSRS